MENARRAEERFEKLRNEIQDYESIKGQILTGIEDYEKIEYQKKKILKHLNASEDDYRDYHWQMKNALRLRKAFQRLLNCQGMKRNTLMKWQPGTGLLYPRTICHWSNPTILAAPLESRQFLWQKS